MPTDYAQISRDNITEYGTGIRRYGPTLLANLYSDRTHFVYELLQNAEDAQARWVKFNLFQDRLEARHDGRPFNEDDVRGICGLGKGTKTDDLTQIGKFGIGFKSVYAYTKAPQVHSVDEAFSIGDYVHPHAIAPVELADSETLFVFPFDHADVPADVAFVEIASRLNDLGVRTLLFLRHIDQITWRIEDGREGDYLREAREIAEHTRRVYVLSKIGDQEEQEEEWLVLSRPLSHLNHPELRVEIAFRVGISSRGRTERIIAAPNATLVAFLPTEKETRLQFLIQGPYRTTPARDNIPSYDQWNRTLIQETATLVADAIVQIKARGLLKVGFLETLPISSGDFPEGFMFRPIYDSVRTTLGGEEALLPAAGGDYVNAEQAVLSRGRDLIALLNAEQLALLFDKPTGQWLDAGITSDRTPQLREYLMDELEIPEVDAERFARQFNEDFIKAQDDKWVARFYVFLSGRRALLRKPEYRDSRWPSLYPRVQIREAGLLYAQPIIRLSDDQHVSSFDEHGEPGAYLPGHFESSYPTVKRAVLNPRGKHFLMELGFEVLDTYEEVMEKILPKYEQNSTLPERREVRADNRKIAHALKTASKGKRTALVERITALPILFAQKRSGEVRLYSPDSRPYLSSRHTSSHELEEFLQRIGVIEDAPFVDPWYLKIYDVDTLAEMGCIGTLDRPQEVKRHIMTRYVGDEIHVSIDENVRDVEVILETVGAISSEGDQERFLRELKAYSFLRTTNAQSGEECWHSPSGVHLGTPYTGNEDIEYYFAGNPDIDFLDEMYIDSPSTDELKLLGCQSDIRIRYRRPSSNGHVRIRSDWSEHERGLDGFDPDLEIQGLRHALDMIDELGLGQLARIVWNLAKRHPQGIYGTVEWCTRQNFTGHTQKTEKPSSAGKLLRERAWLPDSKGAFHVPSEICLSNLQDDFDKGSAAAKELAVRLGCRLEIDLSQLSEGQRRRFEFALKLTEDEIEMIKDKRRSELTATHGEEEATSEGVHFAKELRKAFDHSPTGHSASMPLAPGPVPDRDHRRDRTQQEIEETMAAEPPVWERFRRVPSKRWEGKNYDTRIFLEEQYAGRCQICGHTFTQRNGRPYFEGLYLVSRTKAAWIDRPGNVLCLCANCCAKMRHGTIQAEQDVIEQLQALELLNRGGSSSSAVEFKLCGEPVGLAFTERHIIDVQEMLRVDEGAKGPRQTTD